CYDAATGRVVPDTREADAAAEAAQAAAEAARAAVEAKAPAMSHAEAYERARADRRRGASLFRRDAPEAVDPETQAAIANAGKGSLLDTRWELARDSKLGIFNFRAYKPV